MKSENFWKAAHSKVEVEDADVVGGAGQQWSNPPQRIWGNPNGGHGAAEARPFELRDAAEERAEAVDVLGTVAQRGP